MEETFLLLLRNSLSLPLLLLIFLLFVFKLWLNSSAKNLKNFPPSPPKLPIIGNLHQLGSTAQRSLKSLAEKYGPVMLLQLGSKPVLVISSAHAAEEILRTHDLTFATRPKTRFPGKLLYNYRNVAFAPYGEYWRQVRSICVLQLLSNKRVQSFKTVREEEVAMMLETIQESCSSSSAIHISEILAVLTNNIISRVAIGKSLSGEKGGSRFKELFEELAMLLGYANIADFIPWLEWINHINGMEAKVKRVAKEFDEYLENVVEEGIKKEKKKKVSNDGDVEAEDEEEKGQQNFVDVLIEIQQENTIGFDIDRNSIKAIILVRFHSSTSSLP